MISDRIRLHSVPLLLYIDFEQSPFSSLVRRTIDKISVRKINQRRQTLGRAGVAREILTQRLFCWPASTNNALQEFRSRNSSLSQHFKYPGPRGFSWFFSAWESRERAAKRRTRVASRLLSCGEKSRKTSGSRVHFKTFRLDLFTCEKGN